MNLRIIISVTLFGALSTAAITWGHEGIEGIFSFIDVPSLLIVSGMIVAGAIWSFPLAVTKQAFADVFSSENLDEDRSVLGYEVFMRLSQFAVASGLYGTLIGLVKMLSNMDDPRVDRRWRSHCSHSFTASSWASLSSNRRLHHTDQNHPFGGGLRRYTSVYCLS